MPRTILTYGTFDLFHIGHLKLLRRLSEMGDRLVVGVSTDEFNLAKGKRSVVSYSDRAEIVAGIKGVDEVVPEYSWDQKETDIRELEVDVFVMGSDWAGKFDHLSELCEVRYLPRTDGVSSTGIKQMMTGLDRTHLTELQDAVGILARILSNYEDLS